MTLWHDLRKVSSQPHLAAFAQRAQEAAVADKQLDGPLSDSLCVLKDKVHALEVTEVIRHHSGDEALQLLHVQRARDIRLIGAGNRPATHTCMFPSAVIKFYGQGNL